MAEIQHRLGRSGAAIVEIVMLPEEVVTFAVSGSDAEIARRPQPSAVIAELADRLVSGDDRASAILYDLVIRPVGRVVSHATSIVVIADRPLSGVPFAALTDSATGHRLIEKMPVALAANASSLRSASPRPLQTIAAISLPSGDESTALPESERELREVTALYPHASDVSLRSATWQVAETAGRSADVIHIAGHTERQPGDGEEALLFAGSGNQPLQRVSWKTILEGPARHARVIVLAACETLRPPRSATRGLSLGSAFSANGADVIGTLMPIPDRDARGLFRSVHRQLAAGYSAADALRTAQLEALHNESPTAGIPAWQSVAVLTTQIPH
jgi:CHAT domain-containing protein